MKIIKMFVILVIFSFFLVGCGNSNKEDILKNTIKKIESSKSYKLNGVLEIINNENSYLYDVDASYMKENNFRVSLKNKTNNHEQIILRNEEGVYVLTPSLNKSFKFQSEWPYNNSQSYILQNIINDIKNDSEYTIEEIENNYIVTTKANYSNNKELINQKIYINKDATIFKIEVMDNNGLVKLKMDINSIDYNNDLNTDYFKLDNNMKVSAETEDTKTTSNITDIIYPMYIPENTYLSTQDRVSKEDGERIILTFAGDNPFMLIQETISNNKSEVLPVYGEPFQLASTIGVIDETSLTWINNGIEYYLVSNTLNQEQLIDVANSLTVASIEK
ncbi:MAG: outer membrane lipoprotein carrier protein LolA [Bacilli bacterium]|nr:outer membrane lipoprotein carrier protein LolA [Bacilli bacterium]